MTAREFRKSFRRANRGIRMRSHSLRVRPLGDLSGGSRTPTRQTQAEAVIGCLALALAASMKS